MTGVISHYEVLEKLGEGGMGVIYKCRDTRLDRITALKVLPAAAVADASRKRRFVQEAKAASALNHPNVVTIYDIEVDQDVDFIAMEYVPGRSLDQAIPRSGMQVADVLRYGVQIADALAAAHAAGIIHRDLKPSNIMITASGVAKVLDFGIAKLAEPEGVAADQATRSAVTPNTEEGKIIGTVAYMSPEQAQGLTVDARSDIFSLGAVLYEMLTGRRAFGGDNKISTIAAILDREPQALVTSTRELDRVVTRCLRKDPARRFQTMADLRVALQELKEESESGRLSPAPLQQERQRHSRIAMAGWAAALLLGVVVTVALVRDRQSADPGATPAASSAVPRQLTFDSADTGAPTLSPDSKLVAYHSNREDPGRYDIWLQQTAGGPGAVRLTRAPGNHRNPVFSRDGLKVYFQSTGPPQGIYEVVTLGGESRLLVPDGTNPQVSPDGRTLAYRSTAGAFVIPTSGGEPKPLMNGFSLAGPGPIWFPDSKAVAVGAQKTGDPQSREWWTFPIDGSSPTPLNWTRWAGDNQFFGAPNVLFSNGVSNAAMTTLARRPGENNQLYVVRAARGSWIASGPAEPVTVGAAWSNSASVANGKLVFRSGEPETALWSFAANTNSGRITGPPERVTKDRAVVSHVVSTLDGRSIVYPSNRTGSMDVVLRDMATGQERVLTADPPELTKTSPVIDATGSNVFYSMNSVRDITAFDVYHVSAQGGRNRKVCEGCGPTLSVTPDGRRVLAYRQDGQRSVVTIVDSESGETSVLLSHPKFPVRGGRLSPDGKWVVFLVEKSQNSADLFIAPLRTGAIPEQDWVSITTEVGDIRYPFWSPDGRSVYYTMAAGATIYLMARRLDALRQPAGAPTQIYEFSGRLRPGGASGGAGLAAGNQFVALSDRFVGVLSEVNYNIWIMDLPAPLR
jgi:eukaryotic-like serine/threonine-protein kinase